MWFSFGLLMMLCQLAFANVFLHRPEPENLEQGDFLQQKSKFFDQLEEALGNDFRVATAGRLEDVERTLRPIFDALPKRFSTGKVGPPAARYALHRLFIQRHGWQVKGLAANGETWAENPASAALAHKIPHTVKGLFDYRLNSTGLDLHELAVFASMLEHLIHSEADDRLKSAYNFNGFEAATTALLRNRSATQIIETYMAIYVSGFNITEVATARMKHVINNIQDYYPAWRETLPFVHKVQHDAGKNLESYSFQDVVSVVEQIGERFGRFQNQECINLKKSLTKLEETPGSGRVRLGDFYSGGWQFSESVSYLRQLGALDESDEGNLRVIIPNYLNAPSNCIASSAYYGVCCIDECEDIVGQLERKLRVPIASPAEVAEVVRLQLVEFPSAIVTRNRTLSKALLDKLQDLAVHHEGMVPLHGRLFAQWLHLVYPRECPYPHVSGTIQPKTVGEWKASGQTEMVYQEERQHYIQAAARLREETRLQATDENAAAMEDRCTPMWTMEEELVDEHAHHMLMHNLKQADRKRGTQSKLLFVLFSGSAVASLALSLWRFLVQGVTAAAGVSQVEVQNRICSAGWPSTPPVHIHCV